MFLLFSHARVSLVHHFVFLSIWSVWQEWVRDEEGINPLIGGQDLGVYVLEIDAMGEYLYGICYSPSSRAVTVVLGVSSKAALARLGRAGRMTEYRFPQQERVVGVDAYWGEHILGHTSLLQNVLHQIRLLRVPYTHLAFCGYGPKSLAFVVVVVVVVVVIV